MERIEMPPVEKISRESVLAAALELVREGGMDVLSARALAHRLDCSVQPVFRHFATMEDLRRDVVAAAGDYYARFFDARLQRPDVPAYKASGLAYIQFAREEAQLFRLLFMRKRTPEEMAASEHSFDVAVGLVRAATGLDHDQATRFHITLWVFVHGIACLIVTGHLDLDDDVVGDLMAQAYQGAVGLNGNTAGTGTP